MRVGILTTSYPRFEGDVAGAFVGDFVAALRACAHQVDVLAPEDDKGRGPVNGFAVRYAPRSLQKTFYGGGVPNNVRDLRAWPGLLSFPSALVAAARKRALRWDAVVSHFAVPCALAAQLAAPKAGRLAVWHSADVSLALRVPGLARWARAAAHHHWCVSADAARRLELDDALVAPMASHVHAFERGAARRALGVHGYCVLFVGRFVPIKGLDVLIEALEPGVELVLVGEGPEGERLRALAAARGARVRFTGVLPPLERDRWLAAADLFAMPSRSRSSLLFGSRTEGAPRAVLEAQLAGLPVLASHIAGLRERVRDGIDGRLVAPGDVRAWRIALRDAAQGKMAGMGEKGRARAAFHDLSRWGQQIESALHVACRRASRSRL